ncbi:hypothetical protein CDAR_389181 [Caerostris darwini]|uniref:Uncharacterized protein n=1 Tax=Caerostris darwini TaxID=1538125 RepID=A0AAV4TNF9_9ARAC|nr:hypothetical protein CDAR_389181 [Caerostris darwini]
MNLYEACAAVQPFLSRSASPRERIRRGVACRNRCRVRDRARSLAEHFFPPPPRAHPGRKVCPGLAEGGERAIIPDRHASEGSTWYVADVRMAWYIAEHSILREIKLVRFVLLKTVSFFL